MAKVNNTQDRELMETMTLSWEALPELAKDRWEQAVGYDLAVETQLAKAKSTRSEAELERQRVANEILEATREVCKSIIIDSKRSLKKPAAPRAMPRTNSWNPRTTRSSPKP